MDENAGAVSNRSGETREIFEEASSWIRLPTYFISLLFSALPCTYEAHDTSWPCVSVCVRDGECSPRVCQCVCFPSFASESIGGFCGFVDGSVAMHCCSLGAVSSISSADRPIAIFEADRVSCRCCRRRIAASGANEAAESLAV